MRSHQSRPVITRIFNRENLFGCSSPIFGWEEYLPELGLEYLIAPESEVTKTDEIAESLVTVEILYILASNPASQLQILNRLRTNFDLIADADRVKKVMEELIAGRMIGNSQIFSGMNPSRRHRKLSRLRLSGLSKLSELLESLSEITLTMQLGLNQRLASAEE
jgi:hypothetical protein